MAIVFLPDPTEMILNVSGSSGNENTCFYNVRHGQSTVSFVVGGCFIIIPSLTYLSNRQGITFFYYGCPVQFLKYSISCFYPANGDLFGKKTPIFLPLLPQRLVCCRRSSQLLWWWAQGGNVDRNRGRLKPDCSCFLMVSVALSELNGDWFQGFHRLFVVFCLRFSQLAQNNTQAQKESEILKWIMFVQDGCNSLPSSLCLLCWDLDAQKSPSSHPDWSQFLVMHNSYPEAFVTKTSYCLFPSLISLLLYF